MINKIVLAIVACFSFSFGFAEENLSIVYVHIGDVLPKHLLESIRQARLHNPEEDIYLCANRSALDKVQRRLERLAVKEVPVEQLPQSQQHQQFLKTTSFTEAFWIRTTERLLFVHEVIHEKQLENVFHIESDVMLYDSFRDMLPLFVKNYPSMAIPFANDEAAICSVVFIKNESAASLMADCIARHAPEGENDMRLPGILKEEMGTDVIDHLPILPPAYVDYVSQSMFANRIGGTVQDKFAYSKHFEDFSCVFDAVAFGLMLSKQLTCEGTIFDPKVFNVFWGRNARGLYVPYVEYAGFKCRISNLHIHGKNLKDFRSDKKSPPASWMNGSFVKALGRY